MKKGTSPADILVILSQQDSQHQQRQYGIADMQGRSISFSGTGDGAFAGQAFGTSGSLTYAIQGNVLTGSPVIEKAEAALLETEGDLATRVLAAMLAARDMGGDGRCSCSFSQPTRCGSPPDNFQKSAHVGYFVLSRIGDTDGDCNKALGCVNGDYYLDINVVLGGSAPDPVFVMAKQVEEWRAALQGRPDHILSETSIVPAELPADGVSDATLTIRLRDVEGDPIKHGGAEVIVTHDDSSAHSSTIGPVTDHGDGTYSCSLIAGKQPGTDVFRVLVLDGIRPVTLYPFPTLELVPPALWSPTTQVSASSPAPIDLLLRGPAKRLYLLTVPPVFHSALGGPLVSFPGRLDDGGRAQVTLKPTTSQLTPWVGDRFAFQFVTLAPVDFASNAWPILITN
jgi:hypothetical protein